MGPAMILLPSFYLREKRDEQCKHSEKDLAICESLVLNRSKSKHSEDTEHSSTRP